MLKTNKEIEEGFDKINNVNYSCKKGHDNIAQCIMQECDIASLKEKYKSFLLSQRKEDITEIQKMIEDEIYLEEEMGVDRAYYNKMGYNRALSDLSAKLSLLDKENI